MRRTESLPVLAWKTGRGLQTKEYEWPPDAQQGKANELDQECSGRNTAGQCLTFIPVLHL